MQQKQRWIWGAGVPLLLLVASILPRTIALGALTNPDELRWLERSVSFYDALGRGDWAATLEAFHPGIVPAWGFGSLLTARFGLAQLRAWQAADALPMADLARTALLFPTILSAVTVLASYGLMRRLAGREAAFYGALLLAVEPYYLAFTHAIHLDLTQASFMALAALLWLNYLHGPRHWLFLVGSGIAGAMAVLTRTGALYLVPYSLLALVLYSLAAKPSGEKLQFVKDWLPSIGRAALAWGAWFAVLALTTFVLWPALWVQPLQALGQLRGGILRSLENPHATPVYFLGEVMSRDPGILY